MKILPIFFLFSAFFLGISCVFLPAKSEIQTQSIVRARRQQWVNNTNQMISFFRICLILLSQSATTYAVKWTNIMVDLWLFGLCEQFFLPPECHGQVQPNVNKMGNTKQWKKVNSSRDLFIYFCDCLLFSFYRLPAIIACWVCVEIESFDSLPV